VVFKLDPTGKETVMYGFTGGPDGGEPHAGLVRDSQGNPYGTTVYGGGTSGCIIPRGCGVIFKLDPAGTETVLYRFPGETGAWSPLGVLRTSSGNFFGIAEFGGFSTCGLIDGCGVAFRLDPAGATTLLHSFTGGADGSQPAGNLIRDSAGNLFGTTVDATSNA
jgi:uncharacterized repeat protein (TIGR03803 family)